MKDISRRSFVKMAGLVAAAATMPGLSAGEQIRKAEAAQEVRRDAEPAGRQCARADLPAGGAQGL